MIDQIISIEESSMQAFADGNASFRIHEWMAWETACLYEERMIPPREFKNLPKRKVCSYLKDYKEA
jgi:hypothetical protein